MKKLLITLFLFCLMPISHAETKSNDKTIYPSLMLQKISSIVTSEHYGDELYWVITEFNKAGSNRQFTIPKYPVHWPTKALEQVKNLQLWYGRLKADQEVTLYIELVEHDAPPFDVDDSVGSVRLVLKNNDGNLVVDWQDSENVKQKTVTSDKKQVEQLTFHGDGGEYAALMYFENLTAKTYKDPPKSTPSHAKLLRAH